MPFCRHCENEIDHLYYRADMVEYGSCNTDGSDWDCDNTENNGDTTYTCPECEEEVDPEGDDILDEDPNGDDEEEETNDPPKDTTKVVKIYKEEMYEDSRCANRVKIMNCKKCAHLFEVDDEDTSDTQCVKCGTKLNSKNLITV